MININLPTREILNDLYVNKNNTDADIGKIYGVSAYTIWSLRKKNGISGINASQRNRVYNPLTSIQKEIILGSILGDGCLKGQSKCSRYFTITHSEKQKEYLLWMYEQLKSICVSLPTQYMSHDKYITHSCSTEARPEFKQWYDKIYIPKKTITEWLLNQLTPLSIAIWYMDDGNFAYVNKKTSVFSFATHCFSEEENYLLKQFLMSKFNIDTIVSPVKRGGKYQFQLHVNSCSYQNFIDLISPNIIDSMRYKIDINKNLEFVKSNISFISKDKLVNLYYDKKMTQEEIGAFFNIHKSTVSKYMYLHGICPRGNVDSQLCGKNAKIHHNELGQFVSNPLTDIEEKRVIELFKEMRDNGFPYHVKESIESYGSHIDRLIMVDCHFENGAFNYSRCGMNIISDFAPQIFNMSAIGSKTPIEIFNDDSLLLDCIRRTIRYAKKETIPAVRSGLKTYKGNRCVGNFPPSWAKMLINNKCNGDNLSALDFSSGFGGRLLGCYASGKIKKYIGIDPLQENINTCREIGEIIDRHAKFNNKDFKYEFICATAEDTLPRIDAGFDIVITSPPYFNKEVYSSDKSQCYNKYVSYENWKNEWLLKMYDMAFSRLNVGGLMAIFISDNIECNVGRDTSLFLSKYGEIEVVKFIVPQLEYNRGTKNVKYEMCYCVRKK